MSTFWRSDDFAFDVALVTIVARTLLVAIPVFPAFPAWPGKAADLIIGCELGIQLEACRVFLVLEPLICMRVNYNELYVHTSTLLGRRVIRSRASTKHQKDRKKNTTYQHDQSLLGGHFAPYKPLRSTHQCYERRTLLGLSFRVEHNRSASVSHFGVDLVPCRTMQDIRGSLDPRTFTMFFRSCYIGIGIQHSTCHVQNIQPLNILVICRTWGSPQKVSSLSAFFPTTEPVLRATRTWSRPATCAWCGSSA